MDCVYPIRKWQGTVLCGVLCLLIQANTLAANASSSKTASTSASTHVAKAKQKKHGKRSASSKRTRSRSKSKRKRGQQAIDSTRARQIQEALIREHYLDGQPSGTWDAATQAAMQRYQAAQGWQTKTVPDSRALIKLGLGPSPEGLLNPESAMTTAPVAADPKPQADPKAQARDSAGSVQNPPIDNGSPQRY